MLKIAAWAPIPNASVMWNPDQSQVIGSLILLVTDGIDNMSHARLEDAIDMCQGIRTAIYIFTNQWNRKGSAQETRTLEALSAQSGGRIFLNPGPKQSRPTLKRWIMTSAINIL